MYVDANATADVLGSMAFTPVKNDMIGNIKARLRPCVLSFHLRARSL